MIPAELVALIGLTLVTLGGVLWWRARNVWKRRLSLANAAVTSVAVTYITTLDQHHAQIAALKRRHHQEIEAYRSAIVAQSREETVPPSPQTPLPPGVNHA